MWLGTQLARDSTAHTLEEPIASRQGQTSLDRGGRGGGGESGDRGFEIWGFEISDSQDLRFRDLGERAVAWGGLLLLCNTDDSPAARDGVAWFLAENRRCYPAGKGVSSGLATASLAKNFY